MKMTKVIREYMDETLSAKRLEANKEARADYDARRKACIDELKALRESMREPVENILRKYDMDMEYKWCSDVRPMFDEVWDMNESRIQNQDELAIIRNKEQVVTSGSTVYPRGLIMGNVVDAGFEETGIAKFALLDPAAEINSLEQIFIITEICRFSLK